MNASGYYNDQNRSHKYIVATILLLLSNHLSDVTQENFIHIQQTIIPFTPYCNDKKYSAYDPSKRNNFSVQIVFSRKSFFLYTLRIINYYIYQRTLSSHFNPLLGPCIFTSAITYLFFLMPTN